MCSTLSVNELAIFSTISLRSSSFFLNTAFLRSNIDICSTFSTRNLKRFDSSLITPPRWLNIAGLLPTLLSLSICAASEILAIGVFSSCVMLLIKSFFISVYLFCLNITTMVNMKVMSNTRVNTTDGIMNLMLEKIYPLMSGKWIFTTPIFDEGSFRKSTCEYVYGSPSSV